MQFNQFYAVRHDTGASLPYASVAVYLTGTNTLASLFNASGAGIANPTAADGTALIGFAVADGKYDIQISSGAYSVPRILGFQSFDGVALSSAFSSLQAGYLIFDTLAHLNADLAHGANTGAQVVADSTTANNGIYQKIGASGSGSWTKLSSTTLDSKANQSDLAALSTAVAGISGVWHFGAGSPTDDTLGGNGDVWCDTTSGIAYGPKQSGSWTGVATFTFASHTPPAFPNGAVGIWWAKDAQMGHSPPYIPNARLSETAPVALNAAPRRLFGNLFFYASHGLTISDAVAIAPDGTTDASTIIATSGTNWSLRLLPDGAVTLSSGTYTVWITAKCNSGATDFKIGDYNTTLTTRTATSNWARYHGTFTTAGGSSNWPMIISADGASATNLSIIDFQIAPGTTDPNPNWMANTTQQHLILGVSPSYKAPAVVSGKIDVAHGDYGLIQFPRARTPTAATVFIAARRVGDGSGEGFQPLLIVPQSWQSFGCLPDKNNGAAFMWNGTNVLPISGAGSNDGSLTDVKGAGYSVFSFRFDGATGSQFVNDLKVLSQSNTLSAASFTDLMIGPIADPSHYGGYEIAGIIYYEQALSDAACAAAASTMFSTLSAYSVTRALQKIAIFTGDSIMYDQAGMGWQYQYNKITSHPYHGANLGVGGQRISEMVAQGALQDSYISALALSGRVPVIVAHIGTNSFHNPSSEYAGNVAGAIASLTTWAAARRASGYKVVLSTLLDRNDSPVAATWVADKAAFRTALLAGVSAKWDALIDYDGDSRLSTPGGILASTNGTYFAPDQVHPTTAGYGLMAAIAGPVLDGLGTAA